MRIHIACFVALALTLSACTTTDEATGTEIAAIDSSTTTAAYTSPSTPRSTISTTTESTTSSSDTTDEPDQADADRATTAGGETVTGGESLAGGDTTTGGTSQTTARESDTTTQTTDRSTTRPSTSQPTRTPSTAPSNSTPTNSSPASTAPSNSSPSNTAPTNTRPPSTTPPNTQPPTTAPPSTAPSNTQPTIAGGLTWGQDASEPSPSWTRPTLNASYADAVYGTSVRRLTSADGTRFNRNTYSRRQAENADGSLFMTYHGDARYHVSSVTTGRLVRALTIGADSEPQWHPTDSNRVRHLTGANSSSGSFQLLETRVDNGTSTVIADIGDRVRAQISGADFMKDRAEGSPSRDGNRWAWIVYDSAEQPRGIVSYDLSTDTVLGITTNLVSRNLDWVSMSPTGRYVLAGYLEGTRSYNADMTNPRIVTEAAEHSDIALDRNGRDAYVYIDFNASSPTDGWLTSVDLATLQRTRIFDLYDNANTSLHISGKGYERPGWVVVSSYNCKEPGAWSCEKVMAVELATNGRILNLAHTYNCGDSYWTETHAVVNRSFDAVYFNSDGGSCGIDAEVYRAEIPPFD